MCEQVVWRKVVCGQVVSVSKLCVEQVVCGQVVCE